MNTRTKGLLATMISAVFFGFIPLFVKTICAGGGNSVSAAFYRFFLSVPILYIYLKAQGISMRITRTEFAKIALITIFGYGGTAVLLFSSYNFIPSGMSTTIHFMYPVFTILGCMIFFKEKVSPLKLLCVALCFGGILGASSAWRCPFCPVSPMPSIRSIWKKAVCKRWKISS